MKVLYYDCFCGISGDMHIAAMLDLGVPQEYLLKEISKLKIDSEYEIKIQKTIKKGITGTRVDVILKNEHDHHYNHHYDNLSDENIVGHSHNHQHEHPHTHHHHEDNEHNMEHHHRGLKEIEEIINSSDLSDNVKKLSIKTLMKVAEAEAKVHGKDLYEVHFHEVGAIDSIIDIVASAITLDYLKVDKIIASSIQLGGGFVKCAHGIIPVPAPATVEILKGIPVKTGVVEFETTTPTGAAILSANVQEYTDKIDFQIDKVAYGLGHRELEIPNVLRVYLGTIQESEKIEEQYIIETNIDDMNPEFYEYTEEKLFSNGALDVYKTAIIMKKGRPAIKLSVLVSADKEEEILKTIFKETTSIGVRKYKVEKIMLDRDFSKKKTVYGEVTLKNSYYKGELIKSKPEYEECKIIAKENSIPLKQVYEEIYRS
jgi:pyridinium-3,5-bisthiocarboxylic acid mononucleotide nickel chelatase